MVRSERTLSVSDQDSLRFVDLNEDRVDVHSVTNIHFQPYIIYVKIKILIATLDA